MKHKASRSARLADTEVIIHFSGPIGAAIHRYVVEEAIQSLAINAAKRLKELTDNVRQEDVTKKKEAEAKERQSEGSNLHN